MEFFGRARVQRVSTRQHLGNCQADGLNIGDDENGGNQGNQVRENGLDQRFQLDVGDIAGHIQAGANRRGDLTYGKVYDHYNAYQIGADTDGGQNR